jgi:hypothetical protein
MEGELIGEFKDKNTVYRVPMEEWKYQVQGLESSLERTLS